LCQKAVSLALAQIPEEEVVCTGHTQTHESSILLHLVGQECLSTSTSNATHEIRMYTSQGRTSWLDNQNKQTNPLEWWAANKNLYPGLAVLACKYLALLPSSASVERAFSQAGWVVDK